MNALRNGESMQQEILTSSSGKFYYIDRLDDIIKISALTKAKMFYVSAENSTLFGSFEEPYSVITTPIPFTPSNSLYFSNSLYGNTVSKEIINKHRTFFYVPEYPWILFSENRRGSLMNGRISFDYLNLSFIDNLTGEIIKDCLITYHPEDLFIMDGFKRNFINWSACVNRYFLNSPFVFTQMERAEEIQWIVQNKVTEGSIPMNLVSGENQYTFYVFKALIGSMTKQDSLVIRIYPDPFSFNSFMIDFEVIKNKMKIGISGFNQTNIHTYVRMLNLSCKATG